MIKILFIGDIVGKPGRRAVKKLLPELIGPEEIDLVVANGENAAGGFGLNAEVCEELLASGIDVITMGNHTWDNRDVIRVFETEERVIRPANYPEGTPGYGYTLVESRQGMQIGVVNLMGQVFLEPLACPFRTADSCVNQLKRQTDIILVDIHAEATSEKVAMGWYLDGRVTAVLGTHTHIPTADSRILPQGTGYMTDVGMTGPRDSVLGVKTDLILRKFMTKRPVRFEVASGPAQLNAVILNVDEYGRTQSISPVSRVVEE